MTREEFGVFSSALKTYYPKETLLPNKAAMELWYRQLQDIPYQIAESALNKWVATNKWSPSIADIRQISSWIINGEKYSWSDGWEATLKAIQKYGANGYEEAIESLDDITRKTVKRLGYCNLCRSDNIAADRANFRMIFEQISNMDQETLQLPEELLRTIGKLRLEQLKLLGDRDK